jgi:hypothetical protein
VGQRYNQKKIFRRTADGGFTNWTQQYLSNRKEQLLISAFGSERFVYGFAQVRL